MSKYFYADGAIHNDHHKEMTINVSGKTDIALLMKEFMAEDVEVVEELSTPAENPEVKRSSGRTPESLFKDRNGRKDEKRTQEEAASFRKYLRENQLLNLPIDTSKENGINKTFVNFYKQWMKEKAVSVQPNGNACFRFLQEDCGLTIEKDMKTYANFIREFISNSADE